MKFEHACILAIAVPAVLGAVFAAGAHVGFHAMLDGFREVNGGVRSPGAVPSDYVKAAPSVAATAAFPAVIEAEVFPRKANGEPAHIYTNPGPYPTEQRTWADLFAACRLTDAWLSSDIDGNPGCYPLGQKAENAP